MHRRGVRPVRTQSEPRCGCFTRGKNVLGLQWCAFRCYLGCDLLKRLGKSDFSNVFYLTFHTWVLAASIVYVSRFPPRPLEAQQHNALVFRGRAFEQDQAGGTIHVALSVEVDIVFLLQHTTSRYTHTSINNIPFKWHAALFFFYFLFPNLTHYYFRPFF